MDAPQVQVSVPLPDRVVVLEVNAWQVAHRSPGDLVTAEVVKVVSRADSE